MKIIDKLKNDYENIPDLVERKIKYNFFYIHLFYLETVSSSDRVNSFILKNITNLNKNKTINNILAVPNLKKAKYYEIENYLSSGFTILIYRNKIYALETKADLDRSISDPKVEPSLYGPKDSFVENYQKNIGLVKRRIKSSHLKTKEYKIGRYTKTITGLLYLDNNVNIETVNKCDNILKNIDTDGIIDAGELKQYFINENENVFPSIKLTERPDNIVNALLNGKIAIIVDNSSMAIILPAVLADFINPVSDTFGKSINVNFLKILRILCFIITIITPAFYIAVVNYNQETIPAKLLTSFISQIEGVPFPAIIEAIIMLFICEMLRESDIRFPSNYGSSISVLGALILGEAAVSASIASPIMIIIIALTFISSMVFSEVEIVSAVRFWRIIFLIFAGLYGLFGLFTAGLLLIISLSSLKSFDLPYMFPVSPFNLAYLKETLIKVKRKNNKKRSKFLTNNLRRQQ